MIKTTTNKATKETKVRKPLKKAIAKKVATKKVAEKKQLVFAENNNSFWVSDGQILNNLCALHQALAEMEADIFAHHVNKEKNDFADWVEKVLFDIDCANSLRKSKTPTSAHKVVVKYLKTYNI